MKYTPIKNKLGDVLAVQILDYDFESESIQDVISLVRKYGVLFWKKINLDLDTYHSWQLKLGYHPSPNIWCSHKKYSIFLRVTNDQVKDGQKGLFEDGELDWHSNILYTPDSEELLSLYGKTLVEGSKTFFANSIPYWKNLKKIKQQRFKNLYVKINRKIERTYEKQLIHTPIPKSHINIIDQTRSWLDIRKSINFEKEHFHLYKQPRFLKENYLRLVPDHPLGIKGLYFPHLRIEAITNSNKTIIPDHKELYEEIKNDYVLSGRYIYQHEWEEGDIILADQLTGIHKRNNIWKKYPNAKRELLRSCCWYKTNERKHFDRSI